MRLKPIVFQSQSELFERLRAEFQRIQASSGPHLISLATGSTFADFYRTLGKEDLAAPLHFTHLDEYIGFSPEQPGGMAHELMSHCPDLRPLQAEGRLLPFPRDEAALAEHGQRIAGQGGIGLQLLGIGRNGHLAFNEPGSDPHSKLQSVQLHPWTIADMGQRFAPAAPPTQALTSGMADILGAERILLVAQGAHKAKAVQRMLASPESTDCPASFLQSHPDCQVLLDAGAAELL